MTSPYMPPVPSRPNPDDEPPTQALFTYPVQQPGPSLAPPPVAPFHVPPVMPPDSPAPPPPRADLPGTLPFPSPYADAPGAQPFPPQSGPPFAAVPARGRGKLPLLIAAAVAVVFLVVGTTAVVTYTLTRPGAVGIGIAGTTALAAAKKTCDPTGAGTTLGDDDRTLLIDSRGGEDFTGVPVSTLTCLLNALDAPMYVQEQMDATRALDGRQQASWGDLRASWTYHPDAGLDAIITSTGG
ncbi:hypothetical protein [Catenuloplanes japonicus]|uniref:hypothetical protein n=1 Tax=Catenuloplanes japonicus TaxID=33876 RepID=UPI00068EC690|nr:hypothetical protein [Catenuloplanes japonicus]